MWCDSSCQKKDAIGAIGTIGAIAFQKVKFVDFNFDFKYPGSITSELQKSLWTSIWNSITRDPLQSELQPHSMHLSFWQDLLPGQSELKEHSVHLPDSQRLDPGQSELKSHSSHLPFLQLPAALEPLSGAGQSEFHLQVWSFTQTPLGEHLSPLLQCQSSLHSKQNPIFLHPPRWLSQAQLQIWWKIIENKASETPVTENVH